MTKLLQGDCLEQMKTLEDNSVDSVVTDPPYGISFMNKKWDYAIPTVEHFKEMLRVLKPGGHILCACGTRTQHRMAVNIEDAGFEIRDIISWIYASGFPKSHNIGKAVDKLQGRNKDGEIEFIEWMRKNNTLSMNEIDECLGTKAQAFHYFAESDSNRQIPTNEHYTAIKELIGLDDSYDKFIADKNKKLKDIREVQGYEKAIKTWSKPYTKPILNKPATPEAQKYEGWGTALKPAQEFFTLARKPLSEKTIAQNVLKWGTGGINIDECRVGTEDNTGRPSGNDPGMWSGKKQMVSETNPQGRFPANLIHDGSDEVVSGFPDSKSTANVRHNKASKNACMSGDNLGHISYGHNDSGSASRFFYCAKASKSERNKGLEGFEEKQTGSFEGNADTNNTNRKIGANPSKPNVPRANHHPTVKPIALMKYLCRLITPKNGTVLDPYMGSGSTGIACKEENFDFIGIELDEEYFKIAEARIAKETS